MKPLLEFLGKDSEERNKKLSKKKLALLISCVIGIIIIQCAAYVFLLIDVDSELAGKMMIFSFDVFKSLPDVYK